MHVGSDHPTEHIKSMDTRDLILISCFVAIFIIGIAGNLLVCYVFLWRNTKNALTTMELLIVFLAVADLIAASSIHLCSSIGQSRFIKHGISER